MFTIELILRQRQFYWIMIFILSYFLSEREGNKLLPFDDVFALHYQRIIMRNRYHFRLFERIKIKFQISPPLLPQMMVSLLRPSCMSVCLNMYFSAFLFDLNFDFFFLSVDDWFGFELGMEDNLLVFLRCNWLCRGMLVWMCRGGLT